ncbi:phosphatidate cytidylyltransferase [Alsobacter sp. SYSU M60028]|uniref:Phosphatidate cytidylyltransferase n=1 Tax=Alsobacter ponti TaxID=2962936 RepID=A0ABT1L9T8_9HYPH|nr:phosphatidate cytidylyltransferase [Alsobacter ponti]MCP8938214.1 phosphatidate cytidylyltransferase [Alsobacter ponti]
MSDPSALGATTSQPQGPSEIRARVVSGIVLAAVALTAAWAGGLLFGVFWTVAAIVVLREFLMLVGVGAGRLRLVWGVGAVAIAAAAAFAEGAPQTSALAWLIAVAGAVLALLLAPGGLRLWSALGVLYASVIAIVPIALRGDPAHGLVAILWLFGVVWLTDIGAYFAGRAIGGPKLWPAVSPKKTWSGFIGGVLAGTLTAVAAVTLAGQALGTTWFSGPGLVALTLAAACVSQGGDLLESALKRKFHVKDSSHLIPGHGGFMDRLDAFWAVCVLIGAIALVGGAR